VIYDKFDGEFASRSLTYASTALAPSAGYDVFVEAITASRRTGSGAVRDAG